MTKDKTVTMSRELAERLLSSYANYAAQDELRAILAAPIVEADGMGEAVAWRYKKSWRKDGWMLQSTKPDPMEVDPETNTIQPLYSSQPAPVSVVLPQRAADYDAEKHPAYLHGWNACLEKAKELNQ